jgi:hypothetical protein
VPHDADPPSLLDAAAAQEACAFEAVPAYRSPRVPSILARPAVTLPTSHVNAMAATRTPITTTESDDKLVLLVWSRQCTKGVVSAQPRYLIRRLAFRGSEA